ncbi:MAG: hypothetical protein JXB13_08955 [Phycisphaerae bacterium]|nr:hypothetical protein [Phycisphaerae bacterium]
MRTHLVAAMVAVAAMHTASGTVWFNNGFEYPTDTSAYIGSALTSEGRWGSFGGGGQTEFTISDAQAHQGSTALKIARTAFTGAIILGRTELSPKWGSDTGSQKQFELSFWVYRDPAPAEEASQVFHWRYGAGGDHGVGSLYITEPGAMYYSAEAPAAWTAVGVTVEEGTWVPVRAIYDLTAGTYGQMTLVVYGRAYGPFDFSEAFLSESDRIAISPSTPNGTVSYIDDLYLGDIQEPATSIYLNSGFEYTPGSSYYGDAYTSEGEWGSFGASANFVNTLADTPVHTGNRSWIAYRAGYEADASLWLAGRTALFPRPGTHPMGVRQFELSCWVYHNSQSFELRWFSGGTHNPVGDVRISNTDNVGVRLGTGLFTEPGATVPDNTWTYLRFIYDLDAGTYGQVTLKVNRVATYGPLDLTVDFASAPDRIRGYLWPDGTTSYIDDVYLGPVIPPQGTLIMLK